MFIVASVLQQIQVLLLGNFLEFFFNSFDLWMPNWQIQRAGCIFLARLYTMKVVPPQKKNLLRTSYGPVTVLNTSHVLSPTILINSLWSHFIDEKIGLEGLVARSE